MEREGRERGLRVKGNEDKCEIEEKERRGEEGGRRTGVKWEGHSQPQIFIAAILVTCALVYEIFTPTKSIILFCERKARRGV